MQEQLIMNSRYRTDLAYNEQFSISFQYGDDLELYFEIVKYQVRGIISYNMYYSTNHEAEKDVPIVFDLTEEEYFQLSLVWGIPISLDLICAVQKKYLEGSNMHSEHKAGGEFIETFWY